MQLVVGGRFGAVTANKASSDGLMVTNQRRVDMKMQARSLEVGTLIGGFVAAAAIVALLVAAPARALQSGCTQSGATVTCTYLSDVNAFVVPDGVSTVHVVAVGGKGGNSGQTEVGALGGLGARVAGDLSVTSGEALFAVVGGNGLLGEAGANGGGQADSGFPQSGGGGGASDVRTSRSDLSTRLVVAGGGGGGGRSDGLDGADYAGQGGAGGDAGYDGASGHDLTHADNNNFTATSGAGGTAGGSSAGGTGGTGGTASGGTAPEDGCAGYDGVLGQGGRGSTVPPQGSPFCNDGGGGGGGGLYGGGGGGGGGFDAFGFDVAASGGGGGGSSLVPSGGTISTDSTGVPEVVVSYTSPAAVSPASVDFGSQAIGSTSGAKSVTLTNNGGAPLAVTSASIGGTNAGDFSVAADACSGTNVAPGSSCAVQLTFAPTATGARSAMLSFVDGAFDSPQTVALSGNGTTLADVRVTIGGPATATTGSQQTFLLTVSNDGPSTALNVVMTAQVPIGTRFVGVTTTRGSCSHPASGNTTGTITCALGDLAAGGTALDSVALKITLNSKGGSIVTTASANSTASGATPATPDPNQANNTASLTTTATKK